MSLEGLLNVFLSFAGIDIGAQVTAAQDTFGYTLVLWLLNLGGII